MNESVQIFPMCTFQNKHLVHEFRVQVLHLSVQRICSPSYWLIICVAHDCTSSQPNYMLYRVNNSVSVTIYCKGIDEVRYTSMMKQYLNNMHRH